MSMKPRTVAAFAGACLALCGQSTLAGPPGIPHFGPNYGGHVPAVPKTGPYTDHTKDKYRDSDAAHMGLTSTAAPQRLNSDAPRAGGSRVRIARQGDSGGGVNRKTTIDTVHNLNVIYDSPTYDLNAPARKK